MAPRFRPRPMTLRNLTISEHFSTWELEHLKSLASPQCGAGETAGPSLRRDPMKVLEPVERYFEAWNSHDGSAIATCFDPSGGYTDPVSGQLPLPGITAYATGLFSAFPDLHFDLHITAVDEPYVVAQWTMNRYPVRAVQRAATDRSADRELPGIDVITLGDTRLLSVEGYFDQRSFLEQLGVQVAVQPANVGPLAFGTSTRFRSANTSTPGALSLTWIDVRSEEENEEVKQRAGPSLLSWRGCPVSSAGWGSSLRNGFTPSPSGTTRNYLGSSEQAPSTRPRPDECSSRSLALPCIPASGFLITSIPSGSGVRSAEP